jgi:SAM-dependent methyltransferase
VASRAEREREAYDEHGVFERSHAWHARFPHVFECPNTREHERLFAERLRQGIAGRRVLEIGCGDGAYAEELASLGAGYVYGIDVSETFLARARARQIPGRLEFAQRDAMEPLAGRFDLIFGRAILHHLDWEEALARLHRENLAPGGFMIFMEPLGGHPLIRLFHLLARSAHTPDERSFSRRDLAWLRARFGRLEVLPFNFLSLPGALVSSALFRGADNRLLRLCDRMDRWLARRAPFLAPSFRQAIFVIAAEVGPQPAGPSPQPR